jgi:hypothetical protein
MDTEPRQSAVRYGLAAYGRAGRWEVSILESIDRDDDWLGELESDNVYLVIRLTGVAVIPEVLTLLKSVLMKEGSANGVEQLGGPESMTIGSLGDVPVELTSDCENSPRCVLIAASGTGMALRVTLFRADLEMLVEALGQVVAELPATTLSPKSSM